MARVRLTDEQLATPLAELEMFGLDQIVIGILENDFGLVTIGDLEGVDEDRLRSMHRQGSMGKKRVAALKVVLAKWLKRETGK